MARPEMTVDEFNTCVANHSVEVLLDSGVYRHLKCRQPDTNIYGFDVVTYPGHLVISGDMGCFVFSRIPDMFQFFRDNNGNHANINKGYWAEKLQAHDTDGGHKKFCPDKFKGDIRSEFLNGYCADPENLTKEEKAKWREIVDDVFTHLDDGEHEAHRALFNIRWWQYDGGDYRVYTSQYIFCLHAIVWAIAKYDSMALAEIIGKGKA